MIRRLFLPALLAAGLAPAAQAEHFAIDPVHTRVAFQASHAGFSSPVGTFSGAHGSLEFDPADWSKAQVDVLIPLATLNLGDAGWQKKILDPTWFDARKFPEAHFVSTKVQAKGKDAATIEGQLTLHGVTAPVTLQVKLNKLGRHPLPPFRHTAGFSATATLSRKAFGIDHWQKLVGDEVTLILEVEATRERGADEKPDDTHEDADGDAPAD